MSLIIKLNIMKNEKPLPIQLYEKFMKSFDKCTDQEIISAFNREAGNCGWEWWAAVQTLSRTRASQEW